MKTQDSYRAKYLQDRFVFLPQLIAQEKALRFDQSTQDIPAQRVNVRPGEVKWDEQQIPSSHTLYEFFLQRDILSLVCNVLDQSPARLPRSLSCWTACYRADEYISKHVDGEGTVQIILCLRSQNQDNGGTLVLAPSDNEIRIFLTPGDAVIFEATTVEHYITPLISTPDVPNPTRVVVVARYYF